MRLNLAKLKEMKPDMTIGELIYNIEKKNKEQEAENLLLVETVIEQYTGKYLKIYEPNGVFGENLEIYKIDSIKSIGYDADFNRLFGIIGTKISFSNRDLVMFEIHAECGNSFSYKQLQEGELIEFIDYTFYKIKYTEITNTLKNIINGKI